MLCADFFYKRLPWNAVLCSHFTVFPIYLQQLIMYTSVCYVLLVAMPMSCSPSDPMELCDGRLEVPHSDGLLSRRGRFSFTPCRDSVLARPQAYRLSHFINWFSLPLLFLFHPSLPPSLPRTPLDLQYCAQGSCRRVYTAACADGCLTCCAYATLPH